MVSKSNAISFEEFPFSVTHSTVNMIFNFSGIVKISHICSLDQQEFDTETFSKFLTFYCIYLVHAVLTANDQFIVFSVLL